ncbi:hypothetical protein J2Z65_000567 [Paenibacillus aceris]|uniref:Uncharacterized protein n=1 Tax=Paenibacillus aceris TaxID=869555 RepID=A0ABS4HRZ8_9BACL|nr:hypothetical protein [Paenibacillus aceris]
MNVDNLSTNFAGIAYFLSKCFCIDVRFAAQDAKEGH